MPRVEQLDELEFQELAMRVVSRLVVQPSGCWGLRLRPGVHGYTVVSFRGHQYRAHRVTFRAFRGDLGPVLDHLCRNRWCVNPWHLEPVTQQVNVLRGSVANTTTCKAGRHEWTPENIYVKPNGSGNCRPCRAEASARYLNRKKKSNV